MGSVQDAVKSYPDCELRADWSAGVCNQSTKLGVLLFESLDSDKEDRTIQPVNITNAATGFSNDLNSFMDHSWNGFYSGQKRLSRFPSQVELGMNYTVRFTGTPAKSFRFTLNSAEQDGVQVKIPYNDAGAYTVRAEGQEIPYTQWDRDIGAPGELARTGCGENRYVGVQNYLEFYLEPGCEIVIEPHDAIYVNVRLDWTLEEFYSQSGVTLF